MKNNGERIYAGLMEREDMLALEEDNQLPQEKDFRRECNEYKLVKLVNDLLPKGNEA